MSFHKQVVEYIEAELAQGYGLDQVRAYLLSLGYSTERISHAVSEVEAKHDVTEIIRLCLIHQSHGILNIATGNVISFYDIAQQIVKLFDHKADIICNPRNAPMPHNGYRAFDPSLSHRLFPAFQYTSFTEGILKTHFEYQAQFKEESYV